MAASLGHPRGMMNLKVVPRFAPAPAAPTASHPAEPGSDDGLGYDKATSRAPSGSPIYSGLKKKTAQLEQAPRGMVGPHQRMMLRHLLNHIDFLARQIGVLDREVAQRMRPFEAAIEMLDAIYGIGRRTAEDILAGIGDDVSRWPSHRHIASWAKLCPGNHESAGKRHSGRTGKGNRWLRGILVEANMNVTRKSDRYYAAFYHRIAARRGKKRAHLIIFEAGVPS